MNIPAAPWFLYLIECVNGTYYAGIPCTGLLATFDASTPRTLSGLAAKKKLLVSLYEGAPACFTGTSLMQRITSLQALGQAQSWSVLMLWPPYVEERNKLLDGLMDSSGIVCGDRPCRSTPSTFIR